MFRIYGGSNNIQRVLRLKNTTNSNSWGSSRSARSSNSYNKGTGSICKRSQSNSNRRNRRSRATAAMPAGADSARFCKIKSNSSSSKRYKVAATVKLKTIIAEAGKEKQQQLEHKRIK